MEVISVGCAKCSLNASIPSAAWVMRSLTHPPIVELNYTDLLRGFPPKSLPADSGEIPDFSEKVGDLGW
jgi:hypothetical protein